MSKYDNLRGVHNEVSDELKSKDYHLDVMFWLKITKIFTLLKHLNILIFILLKTLHQK